MQKTEIILLAGGKGTRMGGDQPKVLTELGGTTLAEHVLVNLSQLPLDHSPLIVVGYKADMVRQALGEHHRYAYQHEQRGTGHAVHEALPLIKPATKHIVVLYGDQPLLNHRSIARLIEMHTAMGAPVTIATVNVTDFSDWRASFLDFGRIVRDANGHIIRIVERKDATDTERTLTEVNPGYYAFTVNWIRTYITELTAANASGELYLTDLIGFAMEQGHAIPSIAVDAHEALGVNTPQQLAIVESLMTPFQ